MFRFADSSLFLIPFVRQDEDEEDEEEEDSDEEVIEDGGDLAPERVGKDEAALGQFRFFPLCAKSPL